VGEVCWTVSADRSRVTQLTWRFLRDCTGLNDAEFHAEGPSADLARRRPPLLLRGRRPRGVSSQAPELRERKIGITPFDCPCDKTAFRSL
jgi:hypothetical protein